MKLTGAAEATRRTSGVNDKDWFDLKRRISKTAEESDVKYQFEAQSLSIVQDKELWAQFQAEARANKISTTAGVKELLRQKQVMQQANERAASTGSLVPTKQGNKMSQISALKPSRLSESDVSSSSNSLTRIFSRRLSFGLKNESTKNEAFESTHLQCRPSTNIIEFMNEHNAQDYRQAIRGDTKNVLSLYDTLNQDQKSACLLRFPFGGKQTNELLDHSSDDRERDEDMHRVADGKVLCSDVSIDDSSPNAATEDTIHIQPPHRSCPDEQESDYAVSHDEEDNRSNNGCFEYPQESRQKASERSGLAAVARRPSFLKRSTRASSLTSAGSCLLVDWDDSGALSDDDWD